MPEPPRRRQGSKQGQRDAKRQSREAHGGGTVDEMVLRGRLERVRPSPRHQQALLDLAAENIAGAERALEVSSALALTGAYDASRHCIDAHLNANGLRAKSGDGAHRFRVDYALMAMKGVVSDEDLRAYRALRQIRNESEYPKSDRPIRLQLPDAETAIDLAKRFHGLVTDYIGS